MRPFRLLLATASALAAIAASAQDAAAPDAAVPPAEAAAPPADATAEPGLSDLADTVRQLEDAPTAETLAEPAEAPPAPAAEAAAPSESTAPAPSDATETSAPEPTVSPPAEPSGPAPPLTRAEAAELDRRVARGRLLVAIARGGLIATRDMLSRISDPDGAGIVGWIAEPSGNAISVTFFANGPDAPVAVFRADVLGGRVTERQVHLGADRPALNPIQARMAAARAATEGLDHAACSDQPFNVFVVPPAAAADSIDVYQITVATQPGHYPFGGHFKTSVAPDGSVSGSRGFTRNCLDLAVPAIPAGQQPPPLAITHTLDPMPTEIHVFLAAWTGRPLLVATGGPSRIWLVTGDGIAEVRDQR